jgi:predicted enzyme related to lactoylglutathione lyase
MAKVVGVGGVFFKSSRPRRLAKWYAKHLGIELELKSAASFRPGAMPRGSFTVWSVFPSTTRYFGPSRKPFMINFVVDDLEGALAQVRRGRGRIVGGIQQYSYGRFGWFLDPDGNKVELWQPPTRRRRPRPRRRAPAFRTGSAGRRPRS